MSRWRRALVTGATKGIGAAIARTLAADGVDLVLVARDATRLKLIGDELAERTGVQVEVLPADLADPVALAAVEARLSHGPAVDVLINNAGTARTGAFANMPIDFETSVVSLNVTAVMRLTHAAAIEMRRAGRGTIVNISSMAGLQPWPRFSTYSATKAFVNNFSESVHEELRGTGVTVTAALVGFVRTELSAGMPELRRIPSWLWITPDLVASTVVRAARRGRPVVVTGARFALLSAVLGMIPRPAKRRAAGRAARRAARVFDRQAA